jgi:hypothetical protein
MEEYRHFDVCDFLRYTLPSFIYNEKESPWLSN